jgi:hypothetical protein
MKTPERTTAEVFPRYLGGEVARGQRHAKMAGAFRAALPLSSRGGWVSRDGYGGAALRAILNGSAEFQERDSGRMGASTSPARRHL